MRKVYFSTALVLTSAVSPTPTLAQTISGNSLYEACTTDNSVMAGFCTGYLIGLTEGQMMGGLVFTDWLDLGLDTDSFNKLANQVFQHCIPTDATNEQLRDVVVLYMANNPAKRHGTARFIVWDAYRDAFPCRD